MNRLGEYLRARREQIKPADVGLPEYGRAPRRERVAPSLLQLIESWPRTPAVVQGRYSDVLAANPLAQALSPVYRPGRNALRAVFLDPELRELYPEWDEISRSAVAGMRALVGPDVADPQLMELVGELSVRSEEFRRLWARHDVRPRVGGGRRRLEHPQVGPLELRYEMLEVTGGHGQTLVIYHAEPDTSSNERLALLASLAEPSAPVERQRQRNR